MLWKTCVNRYTSEVGEDLSPKRLISLVTWPLMKSTHPVRLRSRDEILALMEVFCASEPRLQSNWVSRNI